MKNRSSFWHALCGGIVAGGVGGIVLSIVMVAGSIAMQRDPWVAVKFAGAPFLGERALAPGPDVVAAGVGVASHLTVSIVWGALFGVLFFGFSRLVTLAWGVFWGLVVWIAMYYVVLPVVGLPDVARSTPIAIAIGEHVLFGLLVALAFLPFQHRTPRRIQGPVAH